MRCAPLGSIAVLCLVWLAAPAQAAEPVRVEVDWTEVADADIERCGLSRLRAGAIERLVAEGHAIVSRADDNGIRVSLASTDGGLLLRVEATGARREQPLQPSEPCDATFALEVISRIAELVDVVARERKLPAPSEPSAAAAAQPEPPADDSRLLLSLDATVRANDALDATLGGGLAARVAPSSGLQLGARVELTTAPGSGEVSVLEGLLAVTAAWLPQNAWLGPCAELGPLLHHASSDVLSVTELDALLGAGVQVSAGALFGQALLYGRLRSFEHRKPGEIFYDSGRFGATLRVGVQLSEL